jgi:hypothetical protein
VAGDLLIHADTRLPIERRCEPETIKSAGLNPLVKSRNLAVSGDAGLDLIV